MLKTHPEGLRKAEIARRLGVHRSTVGRYIDQLSLGMPLWERDSRIGIENKGIRDKDPHFNIHEGAFLLSLIRLYEQELNVKNTHASSAMRKLSEGFKNSAPVLSEEFLESAELLDVEEERFPRGYIENFEKISGAWITSKAVRISYFHKSTGESCSSIFEPQNFFTKKTTEQRSELIVNGVCRRIGKECRLRLMDISNIESPVVDFDIDDGYQNLFCPVSEFALSKLPQATDISVEGLNIKESNHRIKNSLFMVSGLVDITFSGIDDISVKGRAKRLQNRIDAIALIHEQLSMNQDSNLINLGKFLPNLIEHNLLVLSRDSLGVKKRLKIEDIQLPVNKAVPLSMIVSELITNSFKYSLDECTMELYLSVTRLNGVVKLRYKDGGRGFKLNSDHDSCGSGLISSFCKQLECVITQKNNFFILEFPV